MVKALGLLSGGLDSMLAVKVLQEQDIDVTTISFITPFFGSEKAEKAASLLNIPLIKKDITQKHIKMLLNPKHGYGSTMNPCIDCHALMLNVAGKIMKEKECDFLFTGEVLGERPMSQNKEALKIVAKESGYPGYILRPLSAKLLDETKPEKEGKVDRSKLLDISGRQRKRQFELAKKYKLKDYPTPGGGCLLTDPGFSERIKDLLSENNTPKPEDFELLKIGRHIRLNANNKIIVGRNEFDNNTIDNIHHSSYMLYKPSLVKGPSCLIPKALKGELFNKAVEICASYCSATEGDEISFQCEDGHNVTAVHSKSSRPKELIR